MISDTPLAHVLRPDSFEHIVGQEHLLKPGTPLHQIITSGHTANIILWGPPGTGKTSLAKLLSQQWNTQFFELNATLANLQDLKKIIEQAKQLKQAFQPALLFIDEVHRFSKTQQDALLSVVEDGTLLLIAATTENPRFSVISGLISRCLILECKPLDNLALQQIFTRAWAHLRKEKDVPEEIRDLVIQAARGDGRKLCNLIELISRSTIDLTDTAAIRKTLPDITQGLDDTTHYDLSSALIKSLRGSDTDASLYWLSRLLVAGEDPVFIARRLVIFSSEDIGNADPQALLIATATMQASQLIGMPEVRITLGQAVTYLATAPKSNASYLAVNDALDTVTNGDISQMPDYLRSQQSQKMSNSTESQTYQYPHNFKYGITSQTYTSKPYSFYQPKPIGFEREIIKRLNWIKERKKDTIE